jgi:hypothetical protein
MAFHLRLHDDYTVGLVAVCDECQNVIDNSEEANVIWIQDITSRPDAFLPFRLVHKDMCGDAAETRDGQQSSQELSDALAYLINNTGTDIERARAHLIRLTGLGL